MRRKKERMCLVLGKFFIEFLKRGKETDTEWLIDRNHQHHPTINILKTIQLSLNLQTNFIWNFIKEIYKIPIFVGTTLLKSS